MRLFGRVGDHVWGVFGTRSAAASCWTDLDRWSSGSKSNFHAKHSVSPSARGVRFTSRQRVCNPARRRDHDIEMATKMFPIGCGATLRELEENPHPLLARLRAAEPVSWLAVLGGWLVSRYDLAVRVMRDPITFTVDNPRFSTSRVVGPSMLSLDGADQARHREPFAHPFHPARVRDRFTGFIQAESDRLISAIQPAGGAELRRELAGPLAVAVVTEALGLRDVDADTRVVLVRGDRGSGVRGHRGATSDRGRCRCVRPAAGRRGARHRPYRQTIAADGGSAGAARAEPG